jgi:hypothetical protein
MSKRTIEPTIATRTLRSHPWHDVHSITHRQMAEKPSEGGSIQFLQNGVRAQNSAIDRAFIAEAWGSTKAWMASALKSADMFQEADRIERDTKREYESRLLRPVS